MRRVKRLRHLCKVEETVLGGGMSEPEEMIADRAGGNAALAQLAHDRQEVPVKFQLLIYPMLDDRSAFRTDIDHRKLRLWTQKNNEYGWDPRAGWPGPAGRE